MANNRSIFLYIVDGRTLWVPTHVATEGENKSVHILEHATPRELSRSFLLFEEPIQLVDDPATAARISGAMTPRDVIKAVDEFRRACTEDHDLLLRRCYTPGRKASLQSARDRSRQQPLPQPSVGGVAGPYPVSANTGVNATAPFSNQALLMLLQQQQQYVGMIPQPSPLRQPPPITFNTQTLVGGGLPSIGGAVNMPMDSRAMVASAVAMPYNSPLYLLNQPVCRTGLMPPPMQYGGPAYGKGGRGQGRGGRGGRGGNHSWTMPPYTRSAPDPLPLLVNIPSDLYVKYVKSRKELVCATMPGPRCTAWAREHKVPMSRTDPRYVFCRGGIVLLIKARGEDLESSKPVELIDQQVCAHFVIHGYCSRNNCMHRHYTERQLRQLIAAKITELRALTKLERQGLTVALLAKEKSSGPLQHEEEEPHPPEFNDVGEKSDEAPWNATPSPDIPISPSIQPAPSFSGHAVGNEFARFDGGMKKRTRTSIMSFNSGVERGNSGKGLGGSLRALSGRRSDKQECKSEQVVEIGVTDSHSDNGSDDTDFFTGSNHSSTASNASEKGLDASVGDVVAEVSELSKALAPLPPEAVLDVPPLPAGVRRGEEKWEGQEERKKKEGRAKANTRGVSDRPDVPGAQQGSRRQARGRQSRRSDEEHGNSEVADCRSEPQLGVKAWVEMETRARKRVVDEGARDNVGETEGTAAKSVKITGGAAPAKRARSSPQDAGGPRKRECK